MTDLAIGLCISGFLTMIVGIVVFVFGIPYAADGDPTKIAGGVVIAVIGAAAMFFGAVLGVYSHGGMIL